MPYQRQTSTFPRTTFACRPWQRTSRKIFVPDTLNHSGPSFEHQSPAPVRPLKLAAGTVSTARFCLRQLGQYRHRLNRLHQHKRPHHQNCAALVQFRARASSSDPLHGTRFESAHKSPLAGLVNKSTATSAPQSAGVAVKIPVTLERSTCPLTIRPRFASPSTALRSSP